MGKNSRNYPFTAIVGQQLMKNALILNAVNPAIGGVLIRGASGTAKSTAVRGLAALLPRVETVSDCVFHCHPRDTHGQCETCKARVADGEKLPMTERPRQLVTLPLNATEDRVAGTLDISKALRDGVKALEPGLLAEANRGILYVDEINLLDDHIVNILLDAAALGVNRVEREGISLSHPARFLLIGTMNPEEGELRPQIADRIGLQVEASALTETAQRVEVMKRSEQFRNDPGAFITLFRETEQTLLRKILRAVDILPEVAVPEAFYGAIAQLTFKSEVPSHRADITILQCAKTMAAMAGRNRVEAEDILEAAKMALGHRLPFDPFVSGPTLDPRDMQRHLEGILQMEIDVKKKPLKRD